MFDPKFVFSGPILKFKTKGFWEFISYQLNGKSVLCTDTIKTYAKRLCGDITFRDTYEKFGWNLNVTVTDFQNDTTSRLLNYLTAPNVLVWSAVVASCSIPGMFDPVDLMMKTEDG